MRLTQPLVLHPQKPFSPLQKPLQVAAEHQEDPPRPAHEVLQQLLAAGRRRAGGREAAEGAQPELHPEAAEEPDRGREKELAEKSDRRRERDLAEEQNPELPGFHENMNRNVFSSSFTICT